MLYDSFWEVDEESGRGRKVFEESSNDDTHWEFISLWTVMFHMFHGPYTPMRPICVFSCVSFWNLWNALKEQNSWNVSCDFAGRYLWLLDTYYLTAIDCIHHFFKLASGFLTQVDNQRMQIAVKFWLLAIHVL